MHYPITLLGIYTYKGIPDNYNWLEQQCWHTLGTAIADAVPFSCLSAEVGEYSIAKENGIGQCFNPHGLIELI